MKKLLSRRGIDRLIGLVALALMVVLPIPALAQPTQALVENWRDTDFGFNSSMLDTNVDGDAGTDKLTIVAPKKGLFGANDDATRIRSGRGRRGLERDAPE
jgi:hypothetical protein